MKRFTSRLSCFHVLAGVTSEPELKLVAGHGPLDRIVMAVKLVPNGCPNKIGAVVGREFSYELIALLARRTDTQLEDALAHHGGIADLATKRDRTDQCLHIGGIGERVGHDLDGIGRILAGDAQVSSTARANDTRQD